MPASKVTSSIGTSTTGIALMLQLRKKDRDLVVPSVSRLVAATETPWFGHTTEGHGDS